MRGVCACLGLRLELVAPNKWQVEFFGKAPPHHRGQKHRRGSTRKGAFVEAARARWPALDFPMTWGTADAAWLALYGLRFLQPRFMYTAA